MALRLQSVSRRLLLSLAFSPPLSLVAVMIHWNPSAYPPPSPFGDTGQLVTFVTVALALLFGITFLLLSIRPRTWFFVAYGGFFVALLALGICLGLFVHRDFFTYVFQHILTWWIILCVRLDDESGDARARTALRYMRHMSVAIFAFTGCWLLVTGYAISTRAEPRWMEAIFYNIYNLTLVFLLVLMVARLGAAMYKRVWIDGDTFIVEGYDFSQALGEADKRLAVLFLAARGEAVSCSRIDAELSATHAGGRRAGWDCATCLREDYPVYKCPKYRAIYNRVLAVKKLLEALEIGDLFSPDGQAGAKKLGWKLRLFDDVRLAGSGGRRAPPRRA